MTCEESKENRCPGEDSDFPQRLIDSKGDILDDILIASLPYVRKSGDIGAQGCVEDEKIEVAASGLVGLSHYR